MKYKNIGASILMLSFLCAGSISTATAHSNYDFTQMQREKLGRGLVAVRQNNTRVFLTWRYLSSDPADISFKIYKDGSFIGSTSKTSFIDKNYSMTKDAVYKVVPVVDSVDREDMSQVFTWVANSKFGYLEIPIDQPAGGTTPSGEAFTFTANDASVGDVTGDGEYEIILKWDPTNSQDNSKTGYTGNVYFDCYKLDGTKLWRIDMGKNIRAGAHYTQFLVCDFDGDGKAEIIMKTADGTIDGTGKAIGNANIDNRNSSGLILTGNEYLTVFNGETGEAMATVDYIPERGSVDYWGDNYGNRSERYLATTAYLDGIRPSAVMCRGYYTGRSGSGPGRTVIAAWNWDGKTLSNKWTFDTKGTTWSSWTGQGYHSVRVADVDGDGCDEIVYGSMTVNNDGTGYSNTKLGHGDAHHLTVFDPSADRLAIWSCHEDKVNGSTLRYLDDDSIIFQVKSGDDVGRCMAADIDPNHKGLEMWSSRSGGILNIKGATVNASNSGVSMNMAAWWDGGLLRNLQDGVSITKYDYKTGGKTVLLDAVGCSSNNSTKSNPCLVADMYGDWREELLVRESDNSKLRLYVSCNDTIEYKFHTFLEDPVYRNSVAHQNVAYNQPTNVGFYFGADLGKLAEYKYSSGIYTLDAGTRYDAYEWIYDNKVIGNSRSVDINISNVLPEKDNVVTLKATFRGYVFEEHIKLNYQTSLNNISKESMRADYSNGAIRFTLPSMPIRISAEIFMMNGVCVSSLSIPEGDSDYKISTDGWAKGIYLVKFACGDTITTRKIIVH